jgi:DNA polymerase I-like protein with 3'-5' exonuclease and polymerase domains
MAVARIAAYQRVKRAGLTGRLISTVHDSIVADVPANEKDEWCGIFNEVFIDLPELITKSYGVEWNVPMVGEVSCGPNMLDLEDVKFA